MSLSYYPMPVPYQQQSVDSNEELVIENATVDFPQLPAKKADDVMKKKPTGL